MAASVDTSKKPSGLNWPSPLEPLVFFVDRSLGRRGIPDALRSAGAQIELHDDHFPQDAQDQTWLAEAGKRGLGRAYQRQASPLPHSGDTRSDYGKSPCLRADGAGRFERRGNRPDFVKALPVMNKLCATVPPPFVAHVSRDGSVSNRQALRTRRTRPRLADSQTMLQPAKRAAFL